MPETNICKYYPHWFRRILDFQALCRSEGEELRFLAEAMDRIHQNMFVQTMDEGTTAQWEAILRIIRAPEEDLEFRRLRVLNRLALRPPFTLAFLREKLEALFGPDNYVIEMDYPHYTLYIEASVERQKYFSEVSALLGIVKPCHITYVARPRIDAALRMSERVASVETSYNYILGRWALGQKPFVTYRELEVLKLETQTSVQPALLHDTAGLVAGDIAAARVNGSIVITQLARSASGEVGSISYYVRRSQTTEVSLVELLNKDGEILTSCPVYLPVTEDVISLRHSFRIKEGT